MTASFSELEFHQKLRENNQQTFLKMVADYEKSIAASMRAQGFKRINQKERTVTFSFGTMTFSRSRWKKGRVIRVPVDEKLGSTSTFLARVFISGNGSIFVYALS